MVEVTIRPEIYQPTIFEKLPRIAQIPTAIPQVRNRPKYWISAITYPESDLTGDRLVLEFGHSNYRMNHKLMQAMNKPIDDGRTLRQLYESGDLSYQYDLPNMVVVKPVVIASSSAQMLFVRRPSSQQTDFYPEHWTVGIDEQMQGVPVSPEEGGFGSPDFSADDNLSAAT